MRFIVCVCLALALAAGGCRTKDMQEIADRHVRKDMLARHDKAEALSFFAQHGRFYDIGNDTHVDQEVVVPLLKRLKEIAHTEQWAMLKPENKKMAYGVLIGLPNDMKVCDKIAEAVQEADDKFEGFILQQWGHEWLLIALINKETYETMKAADPDFDKQR